MFSFQQLKAALFAGSLCALPLLRADLLVLENGQKLTGKLLNLPALHFSFGPVCLDPKQVSHLTFAKHSGSLKAELVTHGGHSYFGSCSQDNLRFMPQSDRRQSKEMLIDPSTITSVTLKPPLEGYVAFPCHELTFQNGDTLPVILEDTALTLSDGWEERVVRGNQLIHLTFNGGVQGSLQEEEGEKPLEFSFVKSPHLCLKVANCNQTLEVPWEQISHVKALREEDLRATLKPKKALARAPTPPEEERREIAWTPPSFAPEISAMEADPVGMILIPGGKFYVSLADSQAKKQSHFLPTARKPSFAVAIPAFYIDAHEVTNRDYLAFVANTGHRPPSHWAQGNIPAGQEDFPVIHVSYDDASAYAAWVGKRLPTELEWQRASEEASTLVAITRESERKNLTDQVFSVLSLITGFEPVFAQESTPPVTFGYLMDDVGGRVAEWTSTSAAAKGMPGMYYTRSEKLGHQIVRRGFVQEGERVEYRQAVERGQRGPTTGFRCAVSAEK